MIYDIHCKPPEVTYDEFYRFKGHKEAALYVLMFAQALVAGN